MSTRPEQPSPATQQAPVENQEQDKPETGNDRLADIGERLGTPQQQSQNK